MEEKIEQGPIETDLSCPDSVNILGNIYQIEYLDKPSEVDIFKRDSLWGQIDFWTRTIRVYDNERSAEDRWHTIFHEVIHGITTALNIDCLNGDKSEDDVDMLALALMDVAFRNRWFREEIING